MPEVTLDTINTVLVQVLDKLTEMEERLESIESRLLELETDYGTGYSIDS